MQRMLMTTGGVRTCSDMFVGSQIVFQLTPRLVCLSTTLDRTGRWVAGIDVRFQYFALRFGCLKNRGFGSVSVSALTNSAYNEWLLKF